MARRTAALLSSRGFISSLLNPSPSPPLLLPSSSHLLTSAASPSPRSPLWQHRACSSGLPASAQHPPPITVQDIRIVNGLPQITLPLPSRNEMCVFSLKPVSNNVGDFIEMLKCEDRGIDTVYVRNTAGIRIASGTSIQTLFNEEFDLYINNNSYRIIPPKLETLSSEELKKISDVKFLISELYEALNIQEFQLQKEAELQKELESLQAELRPLEVQKEELREWAEKRTQMLTWIGLGMMSVQFGVLARLTWWEYSWDIMEPVTYFVTYGTGIAAYAYFVLTKQEYLFNDVAKRQWLISFHKKADKHRWDVDHYNRLQQGIASIQADLRRIRSPLQTLKTPAAAEGKPGLFGITNLRDVFNKMHSLEKNRP